jgi:DNA-binding MurR/RpiR family transcriptional regulator
MNAADGDILVLFSCSGRSPNLVNAALAASRLGVVTVFVGSRLAPDNFPASHSIRVQSKHYSVIESAHSVVAHTMVDLLRIKFGVHSPRHPQVCSRADEAGDDEK